MRRLLTCLALLLWPLAGAAQDFPALYDVTGVAADDVLNVRATPDASGAILTTLPPRATDIEVIRVTGPGADAWGWIGLPEGNGWVAMRFLARQATVAGTIPRPLRCLGTEPFWSVMLSGTGQEYVTPEGAEPLDLSVEAAARDGYLARMSDRRGGLWTMTIARTLCSDGMSDRDYGLAAHVFRDGSDGTAFLSGCCMLTGD